MVGLVVFGVSHLFKWLVRPFGLQRKKFGKIHEIKCVKNTDHRVSYVGLAGQYRDLTTACNMIKLGLVKERLGAEDKYIKLIYDEYFSEQNDFRNDSKAKSISYHYGLNPKSDVYVGASPGDTKRKYSV